MDIQYIKKLIKILNDSAIDEIEIEENKTRIHLVRNNKNQSFAQLQPRYTQVPSYSEYNAESTSKNQITPVKNASTIETTVKNYHEINSPIVGIFYRAPAPDAEPYVVVGQMVKRGMTLCIIEAMKLMNEIESDIDGRIVQILVENGKPVEYSQTLFLIDPIQ